MSDLFGSPSHEENYSQSNSVSNSQSGSLSGSQNASASNSFNNSNSNSVNNSNSNSVNNSSSSSSNLAYPGLVSSLTPQINGGTASSNALAALLGVGGDPTAQQNAFKNFQNSTGYQFGLDQGLQAITQNNAAKGLLNSGATLKALNTFGQNYANTQYQNYVSPLMSLINSGNQAAGTLVNAGGVSNSNSSGSSNSTSNGVSNSSSVGGSTANSNGSSFGAGSSLAHTISNSMSNGSATGQVGGQGGAPSIGGLLGGVLGGLAK